MDVWLTDNFIILSMPCLPRIVLIQYKTISSSGKLPVSRDFWFFSWVLGRSQYPEISDIFVSYGGPKTLHQTLIWTDLLSEITCVNHHGCICSILRQERHCNNIFALLWLSSCKSEQIIHREIYENVYMYVWILLFTWSLLHDLLESLHYCKQGDVYNRYSYRFQV